MIFYEINNVPVRVTMVTEDRRIGYKGIPCMLRSKKRVYSFNGIREESIIKNNSSLAYGTT